MGALTEIAELGGTGFISHQLPSGNGHRSARYRPPRGVNNPDNDTLIGIVPLGCRCKGWSPHDERSQSQRDSKKVTPAANRCEHCARTRCK